MKKNSTQAITTWITAAIILVVGILCIVAENADYSSVYDAANAISIVLGVVLITVGSLGLLINLCFQKRLGNSQALSSGVILATGIFFIVEKSVAALIALLTNYVPYVLLVVGALLVLDAVVILVFALVKKNGVKDVLIPFVVELLIGGVALVLGILALPSVNVIDKRVTIFGIILIVYALFLCLSGVLSLLGKDLKSKE